MSNHYDELTFKTYLAKIFTQIWLLDNYDLKIQKKKNTFILLVQDYIYKLDKRAMATQSSYKFEKRNRKSNYLFRKMKNLLDKNGWEKFMLEKLYI